MFIEHSDFSENCSSSPLPIFEVFVSYGQAYQMNSISKISACIISESNILLLSQTYISLIINGPEHFLVFAHLIIFYLL